MDANRNGVYTRGLASLIVAAGTGGTLLNGCQTRFKETVVGASKDFLGSALVSPDTTRMILEGFAPQAEARPGDFASDLDED